MGIAARMDHHVVAAISISGISLDVLGGLYLAYDLLGGQHGSVARAAGYIAAALACSALVQHVDHPGHSRFVWARRRDW